MCPHPMLCRVQTIPPRAWRGGGGYWCLKPSPLPREHTALAAIWYIELVILQYNHAFSPLFTSLVWRVSGGMKPHVTVRFPTKRLTVQAGTWIAHHSVMHSKFPYSTYWVKDSIFWQCGWQTRLPDFQDSEKKKIMCSKKNLD